MMEMKKMIFKTAGTLAMFSLCACEMTLPENAETTLSQERVPVRVSVSGTGTKVTDVGNEAAINNLQVFAFRSDGTLDAYSSYEGKELTLDCTVGQREFVAVANAGDLSKITTRSQLQSARSKLEDNSVSGLVMTGSASKTLAESKNTVSISVSRLAARVSIRKITNGITIPGYASVPLVVKGIYLTNVAGDRPYVGSGTPSVWLNKLGNQGDFPLLLHSGTLSASVSKGNSYSTAHYFYCYPNTTSSDSSSSSWTPRYTRLVVEASLSGKTYYYPVSIPTIEANHTYDITELKITKLGSSSADQPVKTGSMTVTIQVKDWEKGSSTTVTI